MVQNYFFLVKVPGGDKRVVFQLSDAKIWSPKTREWKHMFVQCALSILAIQQVCTSYKVTQYHGKIWQLPLFAHTSLKASTELVI